MTATMRRSAWCTAGKRPRWWRKRGWWLHAKQLLGLKRAIDWEAGGIFPSAVFGLNMAKLVRQDNTITEKMWERQQHNHQGGT